MNFMRNAMLVAAAVTLVGCASTGANNEAGTQAAMTDQVALANRAADVVDNQMTRPSDKRIPAALLQSAKCIAVFPSIVQAGFIVGGKRGQGIASCRDESTGQWSTTAPAFYTLTGGSVGLQAGAQSNSVILLFLDQKGVDQLRHNNFTLGSDISIAAGPVGYNASIGGPPASVVSYTTNSKGLFAGINLSGATLDFNKDATENVYGSRGDDPEQVLFQMHNAPSGVQTYSQALQQLTPGTGGRTIGATGT